jgi:FKBP-type peptidyl-prolyl cis-trans isomerase FkpA
MKIKNIVGIGAMIMIAAACGKKGGYDTTESGLKYRIHTKNEGAKPKLGDFMTLHVLYKTEKDSVFFDTRKYTKPIKVPLMKPSYKGSFEEGLAMLGAGDSATFLVSADSVFTKVFMAPQLPPFIKKGSEMKIIVKVMDIETKSEVEKEVKQAMEKKQKQEDLDLASYVSANKITATPSASGLYFIPTLEGKGPVIESGKTVTVNYVGKFLNGQEFDASAKHKAPFEFKVGSGQVIPAWDEAISKMKVGGKATIVVPSKLAYGERGVPNEQSGSYIIAPFSPLVFDVEVVSVK